MSSEHDNDHKAKTKPKIVKLNVFLGKLDSAYEEELRMQKESGAAVDESRILSGSDVPKKLLQENESDGEDGVEGESSDSDEDGSTTPQKTSDSDEASKNDTSLSRTTSSSEILQSDPYLNDTGPANGKAVHIVNPAVVTASRLSASANVTSRPTSHSVSSYSSHGTRLTASASSADLAVGGAAAAKSSQNMVRRESSVHVLRSFWEKAPAATNQAAPPSPTKALTKAASVKKWPSVQAGPAMAMPLTVPGDRSATPAAILSDRSSSPSASRTLSPARATTPEPNPEPRAMAVSPSRRPPSGHAEAVTVAPTTALDQVATVPPKEDPQPTPVQVHQTEEPAVPMQDKSPCPVDAIQESVEATTKTTETAAADEEPDADAPKPEPEPEPEKIEEQQPTTRAPTVPEPATEASATNVTDDEAPKVTDAPAASADETAPEVVTTASTDSVGASSQAKRTKREKSVAKLDSAAEAAKASISEDVAKVRDKSRRRDSQDPNGDERRSSRSSDKHTSKKREDSVDASSADESSIPNPDSVAVSDVVTSIKKSSRKSKKKLDESGNISESDTSSVMSDSSKKSSRRKSDEKKRSKKSLKLSCKSDKDKEKRKKRTKQKSDEINSDSGTPSDKEAIEVASKNAETLQAAGGDKSKELDKLKSFFTGWHSKDLMHTWEIDPTEIEFIERVGEGTSCSVYRGTYRGQEVALKVLKDINQKQLTGFTKEFDIISQFRSPYVVFFFGACIQPIPVMVLGYCSKGSLFHVLNNPNEDISWQVVIKVAILTLRGLEALHNWKPQIVHRDLKSRNILVEADWQTKLCDFGESRYTTGTNLETLCKVRGTYAYIAPEVYFGQSFTPKSDVYAFGVILWEIANRCVKGSYESPFSEFKSLIYDFQIIVQASRKGLRPTVHKDVPAALSNMIRRCWDHEPSNRPDATSILRFFEEIQIEPNPKKWVDVKHAVAFPPVGGAGVAGNPPKSG